MDVAVDVSADCAKPGTRRAAPAWFPVPAAEAGEAKAASEKTAFRRLAESDVFRTTAVLNKQGSM